MKRRRIDAPQTVVTLTVKCHACGRKREIREGELGPLDFPMCDADGMPMLPFRADRKLLKEARRDGR